MNRKGRNRTLTIGVKCGLRGYFAVMYDSQGSISSGIGSYDTPEGASAEALAWAMTENLPTDETVSKTVANEGDTAIEKQFCSDITSNLNVVIGKAMVDAQKMGASYSKAAHLVSLALASVSKTHQDFVESSFFGDREYPI